MRRDWRRGAPTSRSIRPCKYWPKADACIPTVTSSAAAVVDANNVEEWFLRTYWLEV